MEDNSSYQQHIEQCSLEKLYDVAEHIDREKAPERFRMVVAEIKKRQAQPSDHMHDMQETTYGRPPGMAILSWLHIISGVLGSIAIVFLATGIAILAWLHIIGGVLGSITIVLLELAMQQHPEARQGLNMLGISPFVLLIGVIVILVLRLTSGIGMWKGTRWGWYLGSLHYMYSIASTLTALIMIPFMMSVLDPADIAAMSRGPSYSSIKYGSQIIIHFIIHFLLYVYFFKGTVRAFFGLTEQTKWKAIVGQIGMCLGLTILVTVLSLLMT